MQKSAPPRTTTEAMEVIADELEFAFTEAEKHQGCKAPWEIDASMQHCRVVHKVIREALFKLPVSELRDLGRRLFELEDARHLMIDYMKADYGEQ